MTLIPIIIALAISGAGKRPHPPNPCPGDSGGSCMFPTDIAYEWYWDDMINSSLNEKTRKDIF